jgi:cellulose synthase/poly-beta-1,6-N-acetylglucosamine synthase-like glycosyltransferase
VHNQNWLQVIAAFYERENPKMIVMPVMILSNNFFSSLQALEFLSLQSVTASFIKAGLPLMCNGANLAFEKKIFEEINTFEKNKLIATGDDTFLMLAIHKKYPGDVKYLKSKHVIVETNAERDLNSFLQQRIRWTSKVKYYKSVYISLLGLLIASINISILFFGSALFFDFNYLQIFLILLIPKTVIDFIFLFEASLFFRQEKLLQYFLFAQILYPFYFITTATASLFGKYEWKKRKY